jgi:hypothetical protein
LAFSAAVRAANCAWTSEGTSDDRSMPEPVWSEVNSACAADLVASVVDGVGVAVLVVAVDDDEVEEMVVIDGTPARVRSR